VTLRNFKNFATGTLGATLGSGATSGTLTTGIGAKMPAVPFDMVIWGSTYASPDLDSTAEIVTVTALTGDSMGTIVRAQEGTSTKAWASGDKVLATITARSLDGAEMPRNLFGGIGLTGLSPTTTPVTLFSSAPSIPAGRLVAGDLIVQEYDIVRRGTQKTQSITIDAKVGGTSIIGNVGTSTSVVVIRIQLRTIILSTTSQAVRAVWFYGGAFNGGDALTTVNTGTTALTFDVLAAFGAAATDTLGLEHYQLTLTRAN
jgi:hypothetical protein